MWRLALCFAACTPTAPPRAPSPTIEPSLLAVRDDAFGPLTAKTPATLGALRRVLAGFDVAPVNAESAAEDATEHVAEHVAEQVAEHVAEQVAEQVEYRVSQAGSPLFEIVPDAQGTILNIHVVSPQIVVAGYRVGAPFQGRVDTCECWGDQTVCFAEGGHVAVALAKLCREGTVASGRARAMLAGVAIRRAIWSPRPLTAGGYSEPD